MAWHWIFTIIFSLAAVAQTVKTIEAKTTWDRFFYLFTAAAYFILSNVHLIRIVLSFA